MYIKVRATASAKKEVVKRVSADNYHISVKEPAERNMANARLRALLSRELGLPGGKVRLVTGHRSPHKIFSADVE